VSGVPTIIVHEHHGNDSGKEAATLRTLGAPSSESKRSSKQKQIGQIETPRGAPFVRDDGRLFVLLVIEFGFTVRTLPLGFTVG
jgi:hypothetical protein